MTFSDDLARFSAKLDARTDAALENIAAATLESIVRGSPETGAPGQPVGSGRLRDSWRLEVQNDVATISTDVPYAPFVEAGVAGHAHNHGPHSMALTVAGFQRLAETEVRKLTRPG